MRKISLAATTENREQKLWHHFPFSKYPLEAESAAHATFNYLIAFRNQRSKTIVQTLWTEIRLCNVVGG